MGGVGGCVWVVWISISMPLYKSHFQEHWALSSTKLILHDRLQALLGSPSKWTIYHPSLLAQPRVSDQGKRKKKREKKKTSEDGFELQKNLSEVMIKKKKLQNEGNKSEVQ